MGHKVDYLQARSNSHPQIFPGWRDKQSVIGQGTDNINVKVMDDPICTDCPSSMKIDPLSGRSGRSIILTSTATSISLRAIYSTCRWPARSLSGMIATLRSLRSSQYSSRHLPAPIGEVVASQVPEKALTWAFVKHIYHNLNWLLASLVACRLTRLPGRL